MKTSDFLARLKAQPALPLIFTFDGDQNVPGGYHLTEVKQVGIESMDCGATVHQWNETHFELWLPPGEKPAARDDHMVAGKFMRIVNLVGQKIPLDGDSRARVFFGSDRVPAALFEVGRVKVDAGRLVVVLDRDRTRCKARERQVAGAGLANPGCCGASAKPAEVEDAGCGCAVPRREAAAACCA